MINTVLNQVEQEQLATWEKEHYQKCPVAGRKSPGPIGCGYSLTFTQISVGVTKTVSCPCGQKAEITDLDSF